jgi:hypothetical protein
MHVFMIGDSVFDNAAYVRSREPDVARQVATLLTNSNGVSSTARDGAVVADVRRQIANLPKHATHIVVSAGGNDALQASHVLDEPVSSMLDALAKLTNIAEAFRSGYAGLLDDVACAHLPVAVCTIYDPRFPDPRLRKGGATALSVINEAITREAFARGFAVLDLRIICNDEADFANPIEPSAIGGAKISSAIVRFAKSGTISSAVYC